VNKHAGRERIRVVSIDESTAVKLIEEAIESK
jgi:hypothetical protein